MNWFNNTIVDFCEKNSEFIVERYNSVSSLIFIIIGIYRIIRVNDDKFLINNYLNMIILGVGSFMFHATLQRGWQLVDEFMMIIIMGEIVHVSSHKLCKSILSKKQWIYTSYIYSIYILLTFIFSALDETSIFRTLYLIGYLPSGIILFTRCKQEMNYILLPTIIGGGSWIISESYCSTIPLHAVWHICMAIILDRGISILKKK